MCAQKEDSTSNDAGSRPSNVLQSWPKLILKICGFLNFHSGMSERRWCSGIMQDSHSCDPGSIPGQRKVLTYRPALPSSKVFPNFPQRTRGSLAEWSKALVLGTSPKGRGFESLSCQNDNFASIKKVVLLQVRLELTTPACLKYCL